EKSFEVCHRGGRPSSGAGSQRGRWQEPPIPLPEPPPRSPDTLVRRQEEVILALFLNHPHLLGEAAEELAQLEFTAGDLEKLSLEILHAHAEHPDLDADGLRLHLSGKGYARIVASVLAPQVLNHASFARTEAEPEVARSGWQQVRVQFRRRQYPRQLDDMERGLAVEMTEERWASVKALQEGREDEDKTTEDLIGGGGAGWLGRAWRDASGRKSDEDGWGRPKGPPAPSFFEFAGTRDPYGKQGGGGKHGRGDRGTGGCGGGTAARYRAGGHPEDDGPREGAGLRHLRRPERGVASGSGVLGADRGHHGAALRGRRQRCRERRGRGHGRSRGERRGGGRGARQRR